MHNEYGDFVNSSFIRKNYICKKKEFSDRGLFMGTSALDNITQNEIMKNIKPLYQDKIVIIITHRLDTISDVDKIFVMSEGRICEEGQHNELMKKGEKYYALVQNL